MQLVLQYTGLSSRRLILPLPWSLAFLQASILQRLSFLPPALQLTTDQVTQLKHDNRESTLQESPSRITLADILKEFPPAFGGSDYSTTSRTDPKSLLKSVHEVLPWYIGPEAGKDVMLQESGKRRHGRKANVGGDERLEEIKRMLKGVEKSEAELEDEKMIKERLKMEKK